MEYKKHEKRRGDKQPAKEKFKKCANNQQRNSKVLRIVMSLSSHMQLLLTSLLPTGPLSHVKNL